MKEEVIEKIEVAEPIGLTKEQLFKIALREGIIQYVRPSKRQRGYFRITPYHYKFPTKKMIRHRLKLAKEAYKRFGTKGIVELPDGRRISRVVFELGNVLKKVPEPKPILTDEQIERIVGVLGRRIKLKF